jgi:hypothetical protein
MHFWQETDRRGNRGRGNRDRGRGNGYAPAPAAAIGATAMGAFRGCER